MRRRTGGTAAVPSSAVSMRALPRLVVAQCALPARSTSHDLLPKLLIHPRRCLCSPRALSPIILLLRTHGQGCASSARVDLGVGRPPFRVLSLTSPALARTALPMCPPRLMLTNWVRCAAAEPPKCAAPPRAPEARARRLRPERARRPDRRRYRSGQLYPPTFSSSSSDAVQEPGRAFECADCC